MSASSPDTSSKLAAGTNASIVPVFEMEQLQVMAPSSASFTWYRTAPQWQPPAYVLASAMGPPRAGSSAGILTPSGSRRRSGCPAPGSAAGAGRTLSPNNRASIRLIVMSDVQ